ncbi:MAG: transglutaminaseTgpA domain-containing protein, partial [Planctomycetota bacterium]
MSKRALESASVIETDGGSPPDADRLRSRLWLEFLFAFLTAAGGVVLGSGQMASEGTETIAAIAVFTAIVGFLFVDWLKFFELPPLGAYLAMGGAAAYCVREFWSQSETGRPQMLSVALLLVLVQGTLMLQRKSRRILEQLAVFCLLELVVAAIFNDAIAFGLMLFPVAVLGGIALSLLTIVTALEDVEVAIEESEVVEPRSRLRRFFDFLASRTYDSQSQRSYVRTASPDSIAQGNASAGAWTKYAMLSLLPAVLLIAGAFFYVLPRRVEASRAVGSGNAMVGFDDRIRLDQLGRLSQNSKIALKVELTNARTGNPYRARGSLYLRGKTLETYEVDYQDSRPTATWVAQPPEAMNKSNLLPNRYRVLNSELAARFDDVNVKITCETMNRPSLFSIAPYHRTGEEDSNEDALLHAVNRWTLQRRDKEPPYPRIQYSFGTAAFSNNKQSPLIGDPPVKRLSDTSSILDLTPPSRGQQLPNRRYRRAILQCDRQRIPTIVRRASEITDSIPDASKTRASVARAMEQYLANDADFQYTLNLNSTPIPNLDPIEQFMAVDRRGHCQYFASSLALMLRCVGIPSRVV